MRLISVMLFLTAANTIGAASHGSAEQTTAAPAVLLERNEFACDNCLFGMNDYYFCFEAGDKILVGHDKVRTQMRHKDPSMLIEQGKPVSLRYDSKYIWVAPPNAKEIKLQQDYVHQIFLTNRKCQAATKAK